MLITCPTHGETEAYTCISKRGRCIACHRLKVNAYTLRKRLGLVVPEKHHVEPREPNLQRLDPWLSCNQCKLVLADRHLLYLHKREQHSTVSEPQPVEPRSLMPSQLGQR